MHKRGWQSALAVLGLILTALAVTPATANAAPRPLPATSSGSLIQSTFGKRGNFEYVTADNTGVGLLHWWRDNDAPGNPWRGPEHVLKSLTGVQRPISIIQNRQNGNLEGIAPVGRAPHTELRHFYRDKNGWHVGVTLPGATSMYGNGALIQSASGNFEVVAASFGHGLMHWWRNNHAAGNPWSAPTFIQPSGKQDFSGVALIQSGNFGGNLDVVATTRNGRVIGADLAHFYRDGHGWHGPTMLTKSGFVRIGTPALVQSTFGKRGNFEVAAPYVGGGVGIWYRNNDASGYPWSPGNLRDNTVEFGNGTTYQNISMIQSHGWNGPGNFDVIAQQPNGARGEYWRDNASSKLPWHQSTAP
ncbi:hypothetical protein GCM10023196_066070 [Actinoallomurus vinaceus]|uniref:Uncharacterized protein n=1 Tax=Actinoallomurus vinaceus TaxID=1080074 RepID=A0ABP8UKC0_9ACTN